jgi:cytochrome c-type biogenesis protein CcmE
MKKTHIIAIAAILIAIGVLSYMAKGFSTYNSFADASQTTDKVQVVGKLCKDRPIDYNPEKDANAFSFFMQDDKGVQKKVVLLAAKPQEFERSEQIVLTGCMKGDEFVASDMLMKCPSKYKDEEVYIKSEKNL